MGWPHSSYKWTPLGYEQITNLSVAIGLGAMTINIPNDTIMCLIQAEAQGVRWRDDGVAPTATVGMILAAGQTFQYTTPDFTKIQFIQQTAGAILNVNFYK
jgi:hypothetical protein